MEKNNRELSDLVQNDKSFMQLVGNGLKKTGKFLYQTIRQSPDADILLAGYIASYFVPEIKDYGGIPHIRFWLGAFAIKQYLWGHWSYDSAKRYLNKTRKFSEEAFKKEFSPREVGPCFYCGSRYALREYKRQNDKLSKKKSAERLF